MAPPLFLSTMARHFLAVAQSGSVTDAGAALHVAPSAVSRQIALLEDAVGCPLFERQARGMRATAAGKRLWTWLHGVEQRAQTIPVELQGLVAEASQQLLLACTEGLTTGLMPRVMAAFRREHPHVRLYLRVGHADQIDQWLQRGEVQAGLRFATRPADGLEVVASAAAPIEAIVAKGHPLAGLPEVPLAVLTQHPLALPEGASTVRQVLDNACALEGLRYRVACTGNLPTLMALVQQGDLVLLGSRVSVSPPGGGLHLVTVPVAHALFEQRRVQVLLPTSNPAPELLHAFVAQVRGALGS